MRVAEEEVEVPRLEMLHGMHFEQLVLQERALCDHSPEEAEEAELEVLLGRAKSRIDMGHSHRRLGRSKLFVV